jgi:hypothetical protein
MNASVTVLKEAFRYHKTTQVGLRTMKPAVGFMQGIFFSKGWFHIHRGVVTKQ